MSNFLNPQPSPDRLKFKPLSIVGTAEKGQFNFSRVDPSDIVCELAQGSSRKIRLISNPLFANSKSFIEFTTSTDSPCEINAALSLTQRIRLDYPVFGVIAKSNSYVEPKKFGT